MCAVKLIFLFYFLFACSAQAALVTDTDIYILSKEEHRILKINRITQDETRYWVPNETSSFNVYNQYIFTYSQPYNRIYIINMDSDSEIGHFNLPKDTTKVVFYKNLVIAYAGGNTSVNVYKLPDQKKMDSIQLLDRLKGLHIYKDQAYAFLEFAGLAVIDLGTLKVTTTYPRINVDVSHSINFMDTMFYHLSHQGLSRYDIRDFIVRNHKTIPHPFTYVFFHKDAIYGSSNERNILRKISLETMKETACLDLVCSYYITGSCDNYLFIWPMNFPARILILDANSLSILKTISKPNHLDLNVSDTHYYLGITKLNLRYFKSSDDAFKEAEGKVKRYLNELKSSVYQDALSPVETKMLVKDLKPYVALDVIASLYQPNTFIATAEGTEIMNKIITVYGSALLTGDEEIERHFLNIIRIEDE